MSLACAKASLACMESGCGRIYRMYYVTIIFTVLLVFYGILFSLLAYNSFYIDWFIEKITLKDTVRGMKQQILGQRMYVPRETRRDVRVNVYLPAERDMPVVYFAHGGDFIHGDPDDIDAFLNRMKDVWNVAIVSIAYSLIREHVTSYPQEEIQDVVSYFYEHGHEHGFDGKRFLLAGSQAGAYLSLIAGVSLVQASKVAKGYLFLYPYLDYVSTSFARAGWHPGPVAIIGAGSEKDVFACEEYEFELDRAGVGARLKSFPGKSLRFIENEEDGWRDAVQWIKDRIDEDLRR